MILSAENLPYLFLGLILGGIAGNLAGLLIMKYIRRFFK